jgi:hypothetical protein
MYTAGVAMRQDVFFFLHVSEAFERLEKAFFGFKAQWLILFSTRRFIGVADIASVRFSLPAQLLEPTPNLEYWNYLDQPNTFVAIGDSSDEFDRMLEVLRFWFTKDLKYVKGKPCKPYNSTLGEFFRVRTDLVGSCVDH